MGNDKKFSKNVLTWLQKVADDSLSRTIAAIISTSIIAYGLPYLGSKLLPILGNPISIPLWVLVALCLLILLGIILILVTSVKNRKIKTSNRRLVTIQFEEFPRYWRSLCLYDGFEWGCHGEIRVFCSNHNLKLSTEYKELEYYDFLVSICPECEKEGIIYREDLLEGVAAHCTQSNHGKFDTEVRNRLERECSNKH